MCIFSTAAPGNTTAAKGVVDVKYDRSFSILQQKIELPPFWYAG
ncbi:hypothetical protein GPEL0_01f2843 [Geoanaerobacter pelophilus]|uniref:Uncharacterized protein n=1 Tax=Geoanaerobacter pelophilus TaxID=60036 RepID=A0ABQ0MJC2_9BACT|nr:hypothetical protein GPEL0_01f2843 [Geoanaerobacter pelophilus]